VVRIDFEDGWIFRSGITDGLDGSLPSYCFEMPGEIVGADKGQNMGLEQI
jgi:hypothetical protein